MKRNNFIHLTKAQLSENGKKGRAAFAAKYPDRMVSIALANLKKANAASHTPWANKKRTESLNASEKAKSAARSVSIKYKEHRAKFWSFRDNRGRIHQFKNLRTFVSENPNLFEPEDLIWKFQKPKKEGRQPPKWCRAYNGLLSLRPDLTFPKGSWHGWTWFSIYERRENNGSDLLDRKST